MNKQNYGACKGLAGFYHDERFLSIGEINEKELLVSNGLNLTQVTLVPDLDKMNFLWELFPEKYYEWKCPETKQMFYNAMDNALWISRILIFVQVLAIF